MNNRIYTAWSPGIDSEIPKDCRLMETIYLSENVYTSYDEVEELSGETGLNPEELVLFKPRRLALHELLIRVNANILVTEGEREEDLGVNFRLISDNIFNQYVRPQFNEIEVAYQSMISDITERVSKELENLIFKPQEAVKKKSLISRIFNKAPVGVEHPFQTPFEREFEIVNSFKQRKISANSDIESAVFQSLYRVLGSILTLRGFIGSDIEYLTKICSRHACNYLGTNIIGKIVGIQVTKAIAKEDYQVIPNAEKPVLISLKGASASGKSSLRPRLRQMLLDLGINSDDYGTISPDIWRRMLLNYESLGELHKYAGRFTSHEVNIIDAKLDRYIRKKAKQYNSIPHLLVDRFRFDSFASEKISRLLHKTYVQYIDTMYMYFIVTPPEFTVERGWQRGLERGRYKAVDDFLGHCIEAYAGMPKLLFKWLSYGKPRFYFEFLDNSVAKGEYPLLMAKGTQKIMDIYNPEVFINIERYQRINVSAKSAREVAAEPEQLTIENNLNFYGQCIEKIDEINFIEAESQTCYLSILKGKFTVIDSAVFKAQMRDETFSRIVNSLWSDRIELMGSESK